MPARARRILRLVLVTANATNREIRGLLTRRAPGTPAWLTDPATVGRSLTLRSVELLSVAGAVISDHGTADGRVRALGGGWLAVTVADDTVWEFHVTGADPPPLHGTWALRELTDRDGILLNPVQIDETCRLWHTLEANTLTLTAISDGRVRVQLHADGAFARVIDRDGVVSIARD